MKEIQKAVQKFQREQKSVPGGGVPTGTKTWSHLQYTGVT